MNRNAPEFILEDIKASMTTIEQGLRRGNIFIDLGVVLALKSQLDKILNAKSPLDDHGKTELFLISDRLYDLANHERVLGPISRSDRLFTQPSATSPLPTGVAPLFTLFVPQKDCNVVIGDLQERYSISFIALGQRRATVWLWRQVITSLWPFAWAWLKRISGLEAIYRRIGR
jgi:hypothetical protein